MDENLIDADKVIRRNNGQFTKGNPYAAKKGEVRNPTGRPPKQKELAEILKKYLKEIPPGIDKSTGLPNTKPWQDIIAQVLIREGAKGNMKAVEIILDRVDGKVVQIIDGEINTNIKQATLLKICWENGVEYTGRRVLPGETANTAPEPGGLHPEPSQAQGN